MGSRALESEFGTKFDLEKLPPIIDPSVEHLPPFDTFSLKAGGNERHPYVLLDALHDKIKEDGCCRFYQDQFILEGDLQFGSGEILTLKARCFHLPGKGTSYVSFSRTCTNFLGASQYFQGVLEDLAYLLEAPYHIEPQVFDYSDIALENDMGDPLPEPLAVN